MATIQEPQHNTTKTVGALADALGSREHVAITVPRTSPDAVAPNEE